MFTQPLLLAVASAAVVSADIFPAHGNVKRALEARQTEGGGVASCIQPLLSLYSTLPTPPPELADVPPPADPCHITVPPSIAPAYSSYSSEIVSWVGEHASEIESALSACPDITSIAGSQISSIQGQLCTSSEDHSSHTMSEPESSASGTGSVYPSVSGGGSNATFSSAVPTAPSTTGGSGGPAQTTSKSTALAARETGFVGAAIAAVGFLGAIAAL